MNNKQPLIKINITNIYFTKLINNNNFIIILIKRL